MTDSKLKSLLKTYENMIASRESDTTEAELVNSGEANFLASSRGHEGSAILNPFLNDQDWLCCHYRDKALMLARGESNEQFFYSALCKAESHSNGRQMVSHMSNASLNITSLVGPIGNNALQAAGIAETIMDQSKKPIVVCSFGDGTSQQGEVLEALSESARSQLPVLFFVHNNNLAISTKTSGKTFFSLPDNIYPKCFYNIPITRINGKRPLESYDKIEEIVSRMRETRKPEIIIFNVDRLSNHSNADNQLLYRTEDEIKHAVDNNDPITSSKSFLLSEGVSESQLNDIEKRVKLSVKNAVDTARQGTEPQPEFGAERPLPPELITTATEYRGNQTSEKRLSMLEAMRDVFRHQLETNENVYLLGEDIEDKKGDVFGITKELSTDFPGRVVNSALSESTILGLTTGMALAGKHPVAFIQFADFMPLAYNQIMTELGTMYWRTNGTWECPVIVFAACGGYRPGLGPFHSQTNEATYAHIPGVDVYMPSTAGDAVGLLNAAFKSKRPSVFLYPKKLLNNASIADTTSPDIHKHLIPVGKARILRPGADITLVGWGNTIQICLEAAETLESVGADAEVIDLRTIKPYDLATVLSSVQKTGKLIVTHEDNTTCGVGGDIIASVLEHCNRPIQAKRVTKPDTYTPCNFANQLAVLPSYEKILTAACDLLEIGVEWRIKQLSNDSLFNVEVIGSSPSDESVKIIDLKIEIGDEIKAGDILVETEASKSTGEILAPVSGKIIDIYVEESEQALVGDKLLQIELPENSKQNSSLIKTQKKAILTRIATKDNSTTDDMYFKKIVHNVGVTIPVFKTGSRKVDNQELLINFPEKTNEDVVGVTGIKSRYWLAEDESLVSIATDTALQALKENNLRLQDIDSIICATCTPEDYISPSVACLVLHELYKTYGEHAVQAMDINAACSGYLYAIQQANNYLKTRPNARVMVITAEALSKRLDPKDFSTAFLFADAASTTIVLGENHLSQAKAKINRVSLLSTAEDGSILNIPLVKTDDNSITLQGKQLFIYAVKHMAMILYKCCQRSNLTLEDLDLVIPHQANQRISHAIEKKLKLKKGSLFSNIARYGNTSSCTIPIGMSETMHECKTGENIALCAFGSGFTYGAITLKAL